MKDVEVINKQLSKTLKKQENSVQNSLNTRIIDSLKSIQGTEYNLISYHFQLRSLLDQMGFQDAKIHPHELPVKDFELAHFPYKLWTDGRDLYLMAPSNDDVSSEYYSYPIQVFAINDIPVKDLLPYFLAIRSLEGNQESAGIRYFNENSTLIAREFFNEADTFKIKMRGQTLSEIPQNRVYPKGYKISPDQYLAVKTHSQGSVDLFDLNLIKKGAYARISSFADFDIAAIESMVKKLNESNKKSLIIDLRGLKCDEYEQALQLSSQFNKHHFNGRIFMIVDGSTYSGAALFSFKMRTQNDAIIAGEETGSISNTLNKKNRSTIKLPASAVIIEFPTEEMNNEFNGTLAPDLSYRHSARSISEQKDKVLESVIQHIKLNP
ncbi:S41 family peptidase [bacterium]|nr:S41 family peptidase [bacterium]